MALTQQQVEHIRVQGDYLAKAAATSVYTYDLNFSSRYSQSGVVEILEAADPALNLTQEDAQDLSEDDRFSISKATLVKLGTRLLNRPEPTNDDASKFGTLILLWGYASQGYRVYRVKKILGSGGAQLGKNTLNSLRALRNGDLASAYTCWLGLDHINGLGESFFTKILYFLAKVISPHDPIALIKDSSASRNATALFGIETLAKQSLQSYTDYMQAITVVAQAAKITREKVEELLFSAAPAALQVNLTPDRVIETGFAFAQDLQRAFAPPVLVNEEYLEAALDDGGVYRIMLVSDGEPQHGNLERMSYSHEVRPILDGFYSSPREKVIKEANTEANICWRGTPTYVMTTGLGPVAVTSTIKLYNIPGEQAIRQKGYWHLYKQSLLEILPPQSEKVKTVVIVYYAAGSKQAFRDGIFRMLRELSNANHITRDYELHACMYGTTRHPADKWDNLCKIFEALSTGASHILEQMKRDWKNQHKKIAPFFEYF